LCIVKAIDHIQASNPNLKTVWGQKVSVGYGETEPREGSVLKVGISSTGERVEVKYKKCNLFTLMLKELAYYISFFPFKIKR